MNEQELDQLLDAMRAEESPAAQEAEAKQRVWDRISGGPVCARFREQLETYRAGSLEESSRLLLEDHLTRCAGCRRIWNKAEKVVTMPVAAPSPRKPFVRWAIAAGIAAVALFAARQPLDRLLAPSGPRATVAASKGSLYALHAGVLANGGVIGEGEVVRTAGGARAHLQLADGSVVELNERTELSITSAWSGQTIHLDRGDIIVHAAKQRRGSLRVVTRDTEAAVKGTVFTVSTGTAGSLVGVVEGSVAVSQSGGERLLKPGEQAATSPALARVKVREAISWSAEREKHFALLAEFAEIGKQLTPLETRTTSAALGLLPPGVQIYGAIPNLGPTISEAVGLIERRAQDNTALKEWWETAQAQGVRALLERYQALAPMLGAEMVFVLAENNTPVLFAPVRTEQETALRTELGKFLPEGSYYSVRDGMLFASNSPTNLAWVLAHLGEGAGSPFAIEIGRRYERGTAWILGGDLTVLPKKDAPKLPGTENVRFAFVEQRTIGGVEENEATLQFLGDRTGIASWLAAPGAAGSAEYASADAVAVFSAATRHPRQIFDEILGFVPGVAEDVRKFETETGINVGSDLASSLGTDFTLSVESASIPIPGWVGVYEVYQPTTLSAAIGRIAETYNRRAPEDRQIVYAQEVSEGRQWYSLTKNGFGLQWTFDRGYWIVSMDRAVALRAIATRAGGFPLIRSEKFRTQMPTLAGAQLSGFAWINLGSLSNTIGGMVQSPALQRLLAVREPSLVTINGHAEQIQVASRTRMTSLMLETILSGGPKRPRNQ